MTDLKEQPPRRAAADLIEAVVDNMRSNLEPLKYSTLAPSRFVVYVHPDEFARIEQIVPLLRDQTSRALGEELAKLNRQPFHRRFWKTGGTPPVENAAQDWQVEFVPDADRELAPGDILIHSESRCRRQTTAGRGRAADAPGHDGAGRRQDDEPSRDSRRAEPATGRVVHARLRYEDNRGTPHSTCPGTRSRSARRIAYRADVKIDSSVDVSREHARIRRDSASGRFFLIDLSSLGTTVNGQRVPRGYDEVDGTKRENGAETALPAGARIGLADTIFLQFEPAARS